MSQPNVQSEQQAFLENKLNNLTDAEESRLQDIHADQYTGLDDEMPDDFEDWICNITYSELVDYLDIEEKVEWENSGVGNGDPNNER